MSTQSDDIKEFKNKTTKRYIIHLSGIYALDVEAEAFKIVEDSRFITFYSVNNDVTARFCKGAVLYFIEKG